MIEYSVNKFKLSSRMLTHWGRETHISVSKLTYIGSDNGLSPERRQAIIWNNVGLLLIEPLGTNFSDISTGIQTFSFKKMHLNLSSAKWRPFCLGLTVLRWIEPNHFLQLRRFVRSLDGTTNSGGSPKCFTLPHALWSCYITKHQRMAQVATW